MSWHLFSLTSSYEGPGVDGDVSSESELEKIGNFDRDSLLCQDKEDIETGTRSWHLGVVSYRNAKSVFGSQCR